MLTPVRFFACLAGKTCRKSSAPPVPAFFWMNKSARHSSHLRPLRYPPGSWSALCGNTGALESSLYIYMTALYSLVEWRTLIGGGLVMVSRFPRGPRQQGTYERNRCARNPLLYFFCLVQSRTTNTHSLPHSQMHGLEVSCLSLRHHVDVGE